MLNLKRKQNIRVRAKRADIRTGNMCDSMFHYYGILSTSLTELNNRNNTSMVHVLYFLYHDWWDTLPQYHVHMQFKV